MNSSPVQQTGPVTSCSSRPCFIEWGVVFALVIGWLALNVLTYNRYPAVWCDEVSFSEPAINLVKYGSFKTLVWQHQPLNTFPTVNCPLYSMSLVPWLDTFGTSLVAARSFNYMLMSVCALLFWVNSWRLQLVKNPIVRVILVPLLFLGYGMSYAYRCSRPDILGMLFLLLLALSFTVSTPRLRWAGLSLFSAATVWVGLQVGLYAALVCGLAWLFLQRVPFKELVLVASGLLFGAGSLAVFLEFHGVLNNLLAIVVGMGGKHYAHSQQTALASRISKMLRETARAYFDDFSGVFLVLGVVAVLFLLRRRLARAPRAIVLFCLAIVLLTPLVFNVAGHYAFYYSYMLYLPLLLATGVLLAEAVSLSAGRTRQLSIVILTGAVAVAGIVGLPLRLAIAKACFELAPRNQISAIVTRCVTPADTVFSDYTAFFEAKQVTRTVYDLWSSADLMPTHIPGRSFTPEEKERVSVLIIRPEQRERFFTYFGGEWEPVSEPFGDKQDFRRLASLPVIGPRFAHHAAQPQTERFQLQVFRRKAGKP